VYPCCAAASSVELARREAGWICGNVHVSDRKRFLRDAKGRRAGRLQVFLLPDQIKRDKGVWWMPWQQEAMKDVILCDKPWGAENKP
tara:strand:- start:899 stop:1159 length:261 start_codon:yes stop_codon:yes gene_type:complete